MQYYIAVVHKDPDSAYGAYFPDLPGCFTAADRLEDLQSQAIEAITLYLEGEDSLPQARSLDILSQDPDVAEEIEGGAMLIAMPFIRPSGKSVRISMTIDEELLDAIDATVKRQGLNRSSYLAGLAQRDILS